MKKFTKTLLIAAASLTLGLASCRASANNSPNTTSADNAKVSSVTLDITYSSLTIGQSIVLTPTIEFKDTEKNYSPEIKWMNSDASVVSLGAMNSDYSVSVEAVGSGSATVSIMAGYKMASCIINVPASSTPSTDEGGGSSDAEDPTAFTVRLNFSSRSVGVGQSFTLVATTVKD